MKCYYEHAGIQIFHGDCREVLPSLACGCRCHLGFMVTCVCGGGWECGYQKIDAVLADPPYGVNKAEWDSQFPEWCFEVCATAPRFGIMPGVWNMPSVREKVATPRGLWSRYRWTLIAHLTNGMTNGAVGFGNFIPCFLYSDDGVSLYKQDGDIKDFAVGTSLKPEHPSPKPEEAVKWFLSRLEGDLVCDPFMGSGTTLRAAKDLGRRAIGIEIEEKYCEIAAKRLSQEVLEFK